MVIIMVMTIGDDDNYYCMMMTTIVLMSPAHLVTRECPGSELHDARLLVEGEIRHVDGTRTLQRKKKDSGEKL